MPLKEELRKLDKQSTVEYTDELLGTMLTYIGSPDSELRDELICNLFYKGIPTGQISIAQQQWLVKEILEKNLVKIGIDEREGDLVFTRTFSLLVLALIVAQDSQHHFMTDAQIESIFNLAAVYLRTEQDTRGYVDGKGWAHGVAHGADLLVSVVSHPNFSEDRISDLHQTIESVLLRKTDPFSASEEARLSQVIVAQMRHFPKSTSLIVPWLKEMKNNLRQSKESHLEVYQLERKLNQLAESLYFQVTANKEQEISEQLLALILLDKN